MVFKDKTEMELDPAGLSFGELSSHLDRYSRKLQLKENIESQ